MSKIEIIKQVLTNGCRATDQLNVIEVNTDHRGNRVSMERRIVAGNNIRHVLYRFDPDSMALFPYFSDIAGLKKICDYILFAEEGQNCWCFLIELKIGKDSTHKQLIASEHFMRFVINSARRIGKEISCDDITFRRIGISEFNKPKPGLREKELEYDINGYVKLPTQALRLAQLLK